MPDAATVLRLPRRLPRNGLRFASAALLVAVWWSAGVSALDGAPGAAPAARRRARPPDLR